MSRDRIAALALLSYPATVRAARGAEMIGTLQDVSAGSRLGFAREIADLVRLGLRTRATGTASAGAARLIADGLCLAGIWLMALDLTTLTTQRARGLEDPLLAWAPLALLVGTLAVALAGRERIAGVAALVWTVLRMPALWVHHPGVVGLAPELLPIVCFCVMAVAPRRRRVELRRLAWLVVPAMFVLTLAPASGERSPLLMACVVLMAIIGVAFCVAVLLTDPRPAIAGAVSLSSVGLAVVAVHHDGSAPALVVVAAAPVVLAVAAVRTRRLQRAKPI
jgi:hypothetical protein